MIHRRLSPFEHTIWRLSEAANFNFSIAAEVCGPLDEEILNEALLSVQRRHPLLQMRVDPDGEWPCFRDDGVSPLIVCVADDVAAGWSNHVQQELNLPIAVDCGPLARCRVVNRTDNRNVIILTFHHLVGDGISGMILMRNLVAAINRIVSEGTPPSSDAGNDTTPIDMRLPSGMRGVRGALAQCRQVVRTLIDDLRYGLPVSLCDSDGTAASQRKFTIVPWQFDEDFSSRLRIRAKAGGASLHSALSTALMLTVADQIAPGKQISLKHRMPINLRQHLEPPENDEIGMFASMLFARIRCSGDDEFWTIARHIARQVILNTRSGQPAVNVRMVPTLYRIIGGDRLSHDQLIDRWRNYLRSATALTNLGEIDGEWAEGPIRLDDVHFVASPGPLGDFTCAAMSFRKQLKCNFVFAEPTISATGAHEMSSAVIERLNQAVEDSDQIKSTAPPLALSVGFKTHSLHQSAK